ncbi:hypothetical protein BOO69_03885 [Sulfitobacter alexandrii]|uniref:Extensin-like C-terminal domain-containing protein n=1 Tax=Sulfitobacter alexandrii TaxID=1917485 RepID=A0A1J0WES0_9RHOB|nr:extensin family protein [Sulfitobacter alexandrii]APE42654.1 hypothetical protein BOO69_03885 [Sulfitobacter alexandrii]
MKRFGAVCALVAVATVAHANAPTGSLRPVPRADGTPVVTAPAMAAEAAPEVPAAPSDDRIAAQEPQIERRGLFKSLRPLFRSRKVEKAARAQRETLRKGAVCGDLAIQGEAVGRIRGETSGCGVDNAVRVRTVSGVKLSTAALMDCATANALKTWMDRAAKPALAGKGGGLQSVRVAAHYACRGRNNQKGAKISEHGKGRAIDISGFVLSNGTEISVLQGWNARSHASALRQMHQAACGPFGTVLGPEANKFHRDHFHFDTARYRSGSYCR